MQRASDVRNSRPSARMQYKALLQCMMTRAQHIVASTRRSSRGSASSLDLRASRGVGADIIILGLWIGTGEDE